MKDGHWDESEGTHLSFLRLEVGKYCCFLRLQDSESPRSSKSHDLSLQRGEPRCQRRAWQGVWKVSASPSASHGVRQRGRLHLRLWLSRPCRNSMASVPGLSPTLSRNVYQTQAPPGRASTSRLTLIHLNGPKPWWSLTPCWEPPHRSHYALQEPLYEIIYILWSGGFVSLSLMTVSIYFSDA